MKFAIILASALFLGLVCSQKEDVLTRAFRRCIKENKGDWNDKSSLIQVRTRTKMLARAVKDHGARFGIIAKRQRHMLDLASPCSVSQSIPGRCRGLGSSTWASLRHHDASVARMQPIPSPAGDRAPDSGIPSPR